MSRTLAKSRKPEPPPPHPEPDCPLERCENYIQIPLGAVLQCKDGFDWIFTGWCYNNNGGIMSFIKSRDGQRLYAPEHRYHVVMLHTAMEKFPTLEQYKIS